MKSCRLFLLTLLLIHWPVQARAQAGEADNKVQLMKSATIGDIRMSLAPFFTGCAVVGKGSHLIQEMGGDAWEKMAYGGGLLFAYHPRPECSFGIVVERFYKRIPQGYETIRGWIVAGHFELYASKHVKAVPFGRADLGFVTGIWPDALNGDDLELGTHPYARMGVGMVSLLPRSFYLRFEFFYAQAFSSKHELSQISDPQNDNIGFDAKRVGLEFAVGFPLMLR